MPLYQFQCQDCGPFDERRAIQNAGDPASCPACGRDATRVFTAPNLARTSSLVRYAREREEKSRHEPNVVSSKPPSPDHPHQHGPKRPWQIGH